MKVLLICVVILTYHYILIPKMIESNKDDSMKLTIEVKGLSGMKVLYSDANNTSEQNTEVSIEQFQVLVNHKLKNNEPIDIDYMLIDNNEEHRNTKNLKIEQLNEKIMTESL